MKTLKFAIYGAMLLAFMASGPLFAQDAEVEVLTRLKFGWKTFSSFFFQDANEQSMIGFEAEVRWPEAGADEGSFQGLSLVLGLENSSGSGDFAMGVGTLDVDALEIDLGVRYTVAAGSISLYGGLGWARLDLDAQNPPNPTFNLNGNGFYLEVGSYAEIPVNDESTMTLVLGVGLKLVSADLHLSVAPTDVAVDPVSYQFYAGLKF